MVSFSPGGFMAVSLSVARAEVWRERLVRFHASQKSIGDFCQQEGVSQASFYLWRKRLSPASVGRERAKSDRTKAPAGFRPVHLLPPANVSVQLPGGTQLIVPMTDRDSLRCVIETVAQLDACWAGGDRSC
jgi:hypothetical protein